MSVTQQPSYQFRPRSRSNSANGEFDELTVDVQPDRVRFTHVKEGGNVQTIVLWIAALLFMLFVVSVIPAMRLDSLGNTLAVLVGLLAIATVGIIVHARTRTTTIELSKQGIRVEQGTVTDRELAEVSWSELASVELEPVDPKNETLGLQLEFKPLEGPTITALGGIGVGDLNALRQAVLKARRGNQQPQS